jgi:hypothetical protein
MLITTNKMQRNTIFFVVVSGGFPAHHQEFKNCTYSIWYLLSLVAATASVVELEPSPDDGQGNCLKPVEL